jgi:hypothetical protein
LITTSDGGCRAQGVKPLGFFWLAEKAKHPMMNLRMKEKSKHIEVENAETKNLRGSLFLGSL